MHKKKIIHALCFDLIFVFVVSNCRSEMNAPRSISAENFRKCCKLESRNAPIRSSYTILKVCRSIPFGTEEI